MKKSYPRPQLKRNDWINLNGMWNFKLDDENIGLKEKWYNTLPKDLIINVPFCYQSKLSGLNINKDHKFMWYSREFIVNSEDKDVILNIGAIDYISDVYINGIHVKNHVGGNVSFSIDITDYVFYNKKNLIVIRVTDDMHDYEIPRGKQYWKEQSESIFYTRTSGIWQTIWIEEVPKIRLEKIKIEPNIDEYTVEIEYFLNDFKKGTKIETIISFDNEVLAHETSRVLQKSYRRTYELKDLNCHDGGKLWTPENPSLYDLKIIVHSKQKDEIESYFGLRKISIENGQVMLNNRPYYMRLVLDQGYYPEGLMTSSSDEDLINDIILAKDMGFNGVRKHQKVEEERYLYYADKLGLLVWEEMPSAYKFSSKTVCNIIDEWQKTIKRDYNHPSIIAWVPLNESWGVPNLLENKKEIHFVETMYNLTKSLDDTRLVISNDGWEHCKTDLLTIHDYESNFDILKKRYESIDNILKSLPGNRILYNKGYEYINEPINVSEFGGISYQKDNTKGWGYSNATSDEDYINRLKNVFKAIYSSQYISGFCYTQLTDIEQEINGLLTYNRIPKISVEVINKIVRNIK